MNHLRAYAERTDQSDSGPIRFVASTEGVKRDGRDLKASDWVTENFRANPVIFWMHNYESLPIGRAETVDFDGTRLISDILFDPEDDFARSIESKYRRGYLNAVSVGWDDLPGGKRDLLEISAVPIPMDPNALTERQKRGLADLNKSITQILDDDTQQPTTDAEALWTGTAYQMVRLFLPDASDAESARLQTYRRLNRSYERQGKTAPEFMGTAELAALDTDTWRGLFLAGEADAVPELFVRTVVTPHEDTVALHEALARLETTLGVRK